MPTGSITKRYKGVRGSWRADPDQDRAAWHRKRGEVGRPPTLYGQGGTLMLGYKDAVLLDHWTIKRGRNGIWVLTATARRIDAFCSRQRPLVFTAPRPHGFWRWPVQSEVGFNGLRLQAQLGEPEN